MADIELFSLIHCLDIVVYHPGLSLYSEVNVIDGIKRTSHRRIGLRTFMLFCY